MFDILNQETVRLSTVRPIRFQQFTIVEGSRFHSHNFTELVLVQRGTIEHCTLDKGGQIQKEKLQSGDFIVVPPGPAHAYEIVEENHECRMVNIYYLAEWFLWDLNILWNEGLVPLFFASHLFRRPETLRIWQFRLSEQEMTAIEREMNDINAEYLRPTPSLFFVRGAFSKILVVLARAWNEQTMQGDLHFRPEIWRALQTVDRCIKESRSFRVESLAREVGLATGSFSRLFHLATGLSPSEYFGRRRTQHAAHLLLESDLMVGEIAARLGFSDSAHFSRAFVQHEGVSPRAFRARYLTSQ